ncbi:MAG TPA: hypothetical protein VEL31_09670 [Ktedonobacteraceae bacterium]|nr:hypothetical protein [Ktedonobacteraceae bacterium]
METIQYIDLSEGAQRVIDSFPDEQQITFFAHARGRGYEIKPVQDSLLDLMDAQGGMGEGWMQVVFSQE